ncbi:MAG: group II intron reverse transcriptase/maturase [Sarcina sp.]
MKENLLLDKKQTLRNNEYYTMQNIFDSLYNDSKKNKEFTELLKFIINENNILLAYRNIKKNKGSTTVGTDKLNISFFKNMSKEEFVERIQSKFKNYTPKSVRRVEIPKPNGKTRPLGIPCIEDRIIQQCIKQVLEPICEAKFYKHSYGFRPNRSTEHAIAKTMYFMNKNKLHYVVDVDIKGFFDNVNHSKLKKQLWALGIQDKNLICIIGKILKSEIQGIGIPSKGTPQGGIISPLLANVVLNELDWWISSQWENFITQHNYSSRCHKHRAMKNTNLKEMWIVRYADDFKIFCRDYKTAQKIFIATRKWLEERLNLEVSPEKSKVTNLRKKHTEFLGFQLKVQKRKKKYVCQSKMCNKALNQTIEKLKNQIKVIQRNREKNEVNKLNSMILGSHNYYSKATQVNADFVKIDFIVRKSLDNRLRNVITDKPKKSKTYERLYGEYNGKIKTVSEITLFPIYGVRTQRCYSFVQEICNYTKEGREIIHSKLNRYSRQLIYELLKNGNIYNSTELFDNSLSLLAGQQGLCYVTKLPLEIGKMEIHHKKPKFLGGGDEYKNLIWVNYAVHKLIHATKKDTIDKYLKILELHKIENGLERINNLRQLVENSVI